MNDPLISIVLCTYNGERFLEEQVRSLLQQTYPNVEIIISDDASVDSTPLLLQQYENIPSVQLFFQEKNLGPIKNVEFAINQTRGEFIAFSDQDDIWLPEKIEKLYRAIGKSWLVYSDSELVDDEGNSLHKKLSGLRRMYSGDKTKGFVFSNVVWGHTMLINRQLLKESIPIPQQIPHDIWMGFKAATITGITYLDEVLAKYRMHTATVTKTIAATAKPRSSARRYADFKNKLYWIGVMRDHERPQEKGFYNQLYELYSGKEKGRFNWKLFWFLLRYQKELFLFTRKRWTSRVVELWKQARGERT